MLQWDTYCKLDERAYKWEYLKSDEWKRKRDAVINRAMQPIMPPSFSSVVVKRTVDRYGHVIKSFDTKWKSICENEGCANEAKHVHHLTYERIGKEHLEDLQALGPECHMQRSYSE